tara:strand:+ start:7641 stop:8438 length:798 start_codon:yes stop_codon:yes gene_type:complete
MIKYLDLRRQNYEDRKTRNTDFEFDILDWKSNPYSCLKARIYIELSSIFAFLFQFTSVTANHVSLLYCFSGIVAGLLLVSNVDALMMSGLLIFFLKGSLDWTDGLIARMKNQTSSLGHILDVWGSHIGTMSLISSLGIYCFNISNNNIYLFLVIAILFLKIIDFKLFSYHQLFYEFLNNKINLKIKTNESELKKKDTLIVLFIKNFMDDRARTVDPICFFIFLEIIYNLDYFSKIIFVLYFIKTIIIFAGIIYTHYYKGKLEKQI